MRPQVISAIFFHASTYDDQYSRSLITQLDGDVERNILRDTSDGRNLTSTALARSVGSAITLTARHGRNVDIPGGWGEKRLSFIITVLTSDLRGSVQRQVLTGYTDYDGVNTMGGSLDEQMMLYINNSIIIRETQLHTGRGLISRPRIESSEYIVRGRGHGRRDGWGREDGDRLIRPHDIFNGIGIADIQRFHGGSDEIIDTRADFTGDIKLAGRRDNNPAEYFSTVLTAGVMAETAEPRNWNPESQLAGEDMSKSEVAAGAVNVSSLDDNPMFIEFLQRCDFAKEGSIMLADLRDVTDWPEVYRGQQVTKFIDAGEVKKRGYESYSRGNGNSWSGADPTTVAASIIAQAVPSILMTHHVSDAMVQFSNDTPLGRMNVVVGNLRALVPGENVSAFETALEELIRIQVAEPVSHNGEMLVTCSIDCSVVTDIKITISLDGGPDELYVLPMYCDGLVSPQKTDDMNVVSKITNDLQGTIQEIADRRFANAEPSDDAISRFSWDDNGSGRF